MKRNARLIVSLALTLALLAMVGCKSPSLQAYTVELTFNGLGHQVVELHDQGKLTGDAYEATAITMNAVAKQFPELESAAAEAEAAGPTESIQKHFHFDRVLDGITASINEETQRLLAAKKGSTKSK